MERLRFKFKEAKATSSFNFPMGANSNPSWAFWCKPPLLVVKITSNAIVRNGGSMVWVVVRNHKGKVLKIEVVFFSSDIPELAEAYGILKGLILVHQEGWTHSYCEWDAEKVISNQNHPNRQDIHWSAEGVIKDIQQIMSSFQAVYKFGSLEVHIFLLILFVIGA